jgi:hypothetical protein
MRRRDPARLAAERHYALSYAPDAGFDTDSRDSADHGKHQALVNQDKNQETA